MSSFKPESNYIEAFYYLLWQREEIYTEHLRINIPNTLFIRNSIPKVWNFTGKDGRILRKSEKCITSDQIVKAFGANKDKYDIVAVLFVCHEQERVEIKYMNYSELRSATGFPSQSKFKFPKQGFCVLEQYLIPSQEYESLIEVIWNSNFILFNKKTNLYKFHDENVDPVQKCMTFDAPGHVVTCDKMPDCCVTEEIKNICENIYTHINKISFGSIRMSQMMLYFKFYNGKLF
jgi:hypothetical protein